MFKFAISKINFLLLIVKMEPFQSKILLIAFVIYFLNNMYISNLLVKKGYTC